MKTDFSFRINGYATGDYLNKCWSCNRSFFGDKRSVICLPCALKENEKQLSKLTQLKKEIKRISDIIDVSENGFVVVEFSKLKKRLIRLASAE